MTWLRDAVYWHYILGTLALIVVLLMAAAFAVAVYLNSFEDEDVEEEHYGEGEI